MTLKNNHTDGNMNVIKSTNSIVRDKNTNINETMDNVLTLPKIKVLNDNQRQIEISKVKHFSPTEKININNRINIKNISEIKQSIQNILKRNNQSKDVKRIKQRNLFKVVKMKSKDKKLPSFEMGLSSNKKLLPEKIRGKRADSSIKLKTIHVVVPSYQTQTKRAIMMIILLRILMIIIIMIMMKIKSIIIQ